VTNDFPSAVLDSAIPGAEVWDAEVFRERTKIFWAETKRNAAAQFVRIVGWSRGLSVGHGEMLARMRDVAQRWRNQFVSLNAS